MNPFISIPATIWLVLDLVFVLQSRRSVLPPTVVVLSQVVTAALLALALLDVEGVSGGALWLALALVNSLLAAIGLTRQRVLAVIGLLATGIGGTLVLAHSFASLIVMAMAAVICLGSAVFPLAGKAVDLRR